MVCEIMGRENTPRSFGVIQPQPKLRFSRGFIDVFPPCFPQGFRQVIHNILWCTSQTAGYMVLAPIFCFKY